MTRATTSVCLILTKSPTLIISLPYTYNITPSQVKSIKVVSGECQEGFITFNHLIGSHYDSASSIQYTSTRFTRGLSVSWNRGVKPRGASSGSSSLNTMPVVGSKIYTNNSGGQLTIQGGATYPGSAIKFIGGTNGGTGVMHFYSGNSTSLEESASS